VISKIGEVRFLMHSLAISPPRFLKFCERAILPGQNFLKKQMAGAVGLEPLLFFSLPYVVLVGSSVA